jgi:hypothetical protein
MEESILVLKVACAGCAEVSRQITVPRATVPKDPPIWQLSDSTFELN